MNKNTQNIQINFLRLTAASGGWKGHVSCMGGKTNAHEVLVETPEGKKLLGIPRYKRIILKWLIEKWDGRVQAGSSGSVVDSCEIEMNLNVPQNVAYLLTTWQILSSQQRLCSMELSKWLVSIGNRPTSMMWVIHSCFSLTRVRLMLNKSCFQHNSFNYYIY